MKKVMLITGGTDGLGRALAEKFAADYQVVILGRQESKLKEIAEKNAGDFVLCDLRQAKEIEKAVNIVRDKHGRIDCLINNAGVWIQGPLEENEAAKIEEVMEVNATAAMLVTKFVIPIMKEQGGGKIINVISQGGLYAKAERSVYTASKWALTGFTKSLQAELASFGISVAGFYPGPMKTEFFKKGGIDKDMSGYMNLDEVVPAVKFLAELPDHITVPELGLKPLE